MLSGLLITLDILVGICLVAVVLMQRSEGGAFGMGGGPTGMISARGAGDLLTRTTWVLFTLFLALSLGLTLLGAHDRASSSVLQQLKGQIANPAALNQPAANSALAAPAPAPGPSAPSPSPFLAPNASNPLSAPTPQPATPSTAPATAPPRSHVRQPAAAASPTAAPTLEAPPPKPVLAPAAPASSPPPSQP